MSISAVAFSPPSFSTLGATPSTVAVPAPPPTSDTNNNATTVPAVPPPAQAHGGSTYTAMADASQSNVRGSNLNIQV